ncbi:MAG: hypothetical protein AB1758_13800 [Candidatus Eremiobacterota bacterium]
MPYYPACFCFSDPPGAETFLAGSELPGYTWTRLATLELWDFSEAPARALLRPVPGLELAWVSGLDSKYAPLTGLDAATHLVGCCEQRNRVGLANLLDLELAAWLVFLSPDLAALEGRNADCRLVSRRADVPQWAAFFQAAGLALSGKLVPDRYIRSEEERLLRRWDGPSLPAFPGQALEQRGYLREGPGLWSRADHLPAGWAPG